MERLDFPAKELRSRVIARHLRCAEYNGVVIFTCGNAASHLRRHYDGKIVEVGARGALTPNHWFTFSEIASYWPGFFDATPGHLPAPLMVEIAKEFEYHLHGVLFADEYIVPTGSGETILCLKIAFPDKKFVAEYDDTKPATQWDAVAPLNRWVSALFPTIKIEHLTRKA